MPFRQTTVSGFPAIALRAGEVEVVAIPSLGLRLSHLRRAAGREWLWRNEQMPFATPKAGASYVDTADSGGWDECFPTVAPSPVPGSPGAPPLPDHGELWSAPWESSVSERNGAVTLSGRVRATRFPSELVREVSLLPDAPMVRFRYALRHRGVERFPWIWSAHPLLNVQPGSLLELPGVSQARIDAAHGRPDIEPDDVLSWPGAVGGAADRFEFPAMAGKGWAVKLFADSTSNRAAVLTDPRRGERLEFHVDRSTVPQIGIWINCGGWAPAGKSPYYNLAVEPCIGAPDQLERAVDWGLAQSLHPGETRTWTLEVWLLEEGETA
jgi:galactose mutarotase-like enzyme